jgi:hypothetical protein
MTERDDLKIEDTSGLTDADWAEINKLQMPTKMGAKRPLQPHGISCPKTQFAMP